MISDSKRREVAAKLRNFEQLRGVFRESNVCAFCDVLGVGYMDWEHICASLADLIDRPTCRFEPVYEPDMMGEASLIECSKCGWTVEPWNAEDFRYCPSCGAEVVSDAGGDAHGNSDATGATLRADCNDSATSTQVDKDKRPDSL